MKMIALQEHYLQSLQKLEDHFEKWTHSLSHHYQDEQRKVCCTREVGQGKIMRRNGDHGWHGLAAISLVWHASTKDSTSRGLDSNFSVQFAVLTYLYRITQDQLLSAQNGYFPVDKVLLWKQPFTF